MKHNYAGQEVRTCFREWNDYPIDVSPAAGLLWKLGFRRDKRGNLCWPAQEQDDTAPPVSDQEVFLPYYLEPPPVEYGPEWTVSRAPEHLRPILNRLLDIYVAELDREGWELSWEEDGPQARYRGVVSFRLRIRRRWVDVIIRAHRTLREDGVSRGCGSKQRLLHIEDINDTFLSELRGALDAAETFGDRFFAE